MKIIFLLLSFLFMLLPTKSLAQYSGKAGDDIYIEMPPPAGYEYYSNDWRVYNGDGDAVTLSIQNRDRGAVKVHIWRNFTDRITLIFDYKVYLSSNSNVSSSGYKYVYITCTGNSGDSGGTTGQNEPTYFRLPIEKTIKVGESVKLDYTISPSTAKTTITWSSSNKDVATVSNGVVKGLKEGFTWITATTSNGLSDQCYVTVTGIPVSSIMLNVDNIKLKVGETKQLTATITPSNASSATVTWSSENSKIATVDTKGNVTAVGAGTTYIEAKTGNGKTAKCKVTVEAIKDMIAKTTEGVEMKFTVTDAVAKTCEVAKLAIDQKTSGKITIPSSINGYKVTSVGNHAFSGCSSLTSIGIPNTVTNIEDYAFSNCFGLTTINIPNSVTNMGNYVFLNCSGITSVNIPNSVTRIGEGAFYSCESLTSIILSSSLKRLEKNTFYACLALETISGGKNIEYFAPDVSMPALPWYRNLPDGLNFLGKVLIKYKGTMPDNTKLNVPEGCTQIYNNAFQSQKGLEDLNIPSSVVSIGNSVVCFCDRLKKISVDVKNPVYDSRNNCNAIIEKSTNTLIIGCSGTTIPSNVTSIGYEAFDGTTTWEEIVIPNQIDSIADYAFWNNTHVKSILVGKGLRKIGHGALGAEFVLKEITVSPSNPYFDSRDNCNAIIEKATNTLVVGCSSTKIPNTVKVIGESAFYSNGYNNKDFTYIIIPNSVEEIQRSSFSGLRYLTDVTIGLNVKTISDNTFSGCKNIKTVVSLNGFPDDISEKAFESDVYNNATLYVPAGCRNNYRLATGWSLFKNIVEGIPDGIEHITMDSVSENGVVYSLSGQRLSAPQKGVNIINGKKYVVK